MDNDKKDLGASYRHKAVTILFVGIIFGFGIANFIEVHPSIVKVIKQHKTNDDTKNEISSLIDSIENIYGEQLVGRMKYIELNGLVQKILQKNVVDDSTGKPVIRDSEGNLHFQYYNDKPIQLPAYKTFFEIVDILKSNNSNFMFVVHPVTEIKGYTQLPEGVTNYNNKLIDETVDLFREKDIHVLDLREELKNSDKIEVKDMMYKTDHHWTTYAAFCGYEITLNELERVFGINIKNKEIITDINNFNQTIYPEFFIGSAGRRTGVYYSGKDDYTLITPKFDTHYKLINESRFSEAVSGSFEDVIIEKKKLEDDYLYTNRYEAYLGKDYGKQEIINEDGEGELLVIQNSFGLPYSSFLSLAFNKVTILDPRHIEKVTGRSTLQYLQEHKFENVIWIATSP